MAAGKVQVNVNDMLNVREGAGSQYAAIGGLYNGQVVNYYSEKNGWLKIKYQGQYA